MMLAKKLVVRVRFSVQRRYYYLVGRPLPAEAIFFKHFKFPPRPRADEMTRANDTSVIKNVFNELAAEYMKREQDHFHGFEAYDTTLRRCGVAYEVNLPLRMQEIK